MQKQKKTRPFVDTCPHHWSTSSTSTAIAPHPPPLQLLPLLQVLNTIPRLTATTTSTTATTERISVPKMWMFMFGDDVTITSKSQNAFI